MSTKKKKTKKSATKKPKKTKKSGSNVLISKILPEAKRLKKKKNISQKEAVKLASAKYRAGKL